MLQPHPLRVQRCDARAQLGGLCVPPLHHVSAIKRPLLRAAVRAEGVGTVS